MAKQQRVLIFSEDTKQVKILSSFLSEANIQYEFDVYHATKAYKNRPFDLLVADLDMEDEKAEDLLFWVSEQYPLRKIIVTGTKNEVEDLDTILQEKAVLGFLEKPLAENDFQNLLNQVEFGLAGRVQRTNVLDLLQALRMSQPQRLVIFKEISSQKDGVIYLKSSNVIHAELYMPDETTREKVKVDEGASAFYQILQFRNGQFEEKHWKEPEEQSIFMPFDNLAMSASTQLDEAHVPEGSAAIINPTEIRSILLIDQDPMSRILIQKDLFIEGFDCIAIKTLQEAILLLSKRSFDLIITDNLNHKNEIFGFLSWLKQKYPECPLIFLAPKISENEPAEAMPALSGTLQILSKPINLKILKARVYDFAANGFKGYLNQIGVLEFIQLNLSCIDKKKLHIRDLATGIDAKVYVDRGQLIHAEYQEMTGEQAFYKIVSIENGDFMEDPFYEQAGSSLTHILPHKLMLKASRYIPQNTSLAPAPVIEKPPEPKKTDSVSPTEKAPSGVTSLFGDEPEKIGVTSLFGDEDLQLNPNLVPSEESLSGLHFEEEV